MKLLIKILVVTTILSSCAPTKIIQLQGQYPSTPMIFNSDKSFDKVWDNLVDVFAQKGLSIKIIDRSSGLIISGKAMLSATMEDKNGKPKNPDAFIAVPSYMKDGKRYPVTASSSLIGPYATQKQIDAINSTPVYGEWNVRIKSNGSGTTINVNILNVTYDVYNSTLKTNVESMLSTFKSTGVFEKQLSDLIK